MDLTTVGDIFATRTLSLSGEDAISITIGKPQPFPDENGYFCPYQIVGIGNQKVRYAGGEDTVQALILCLTKIGTVLYTSTEAKAGLLTWNGSRDLGFPVPDSIQDLAPQ